MTEQRLSAVVLAAGEGSRMRSTRPKPLHLLCGRAMVLYVLDALPRDQVDRAVVVVGHHAERVTKKPTEDGAGLQLEFVEKQMGRASGRERVWQYVYISVVPLTLQKKQTT